MFLVSTCSCLCPVHWSQVLSGEWRCSWSSAGRRCSNYIWVMNNFIAQLDATHKGFMVIFLGQVFRIQYHVANHRFQWFMNIHMLILLHTHKLNDKYTSSVGFWWGFFPSTLHHEVYPWDRTAPSHTWVGSWSNSAVKGRYRNWKSHCPHRLSWGPTMLYNNT